jgi:hypothetical protein
MFFSPSETARTRHPHPQIVDGQSSHHFDAKQQSQSAVFETTLSSACVVCSSFWHDTTCETIWHSFCACDIACEGNETGAACGFASQNIAIV